MNSVRRWEFFQVDPNYDERLAMNGMLETPSMVAATRRRSQSGAWVRAKRLIKPGGGRSAFPGPFICTAAVSVAWLTNPLVVFGQTTSLEGNLSGGVSLNFTSFCLGRDSLGLGAGLSAQCSSRVSAYLFYDGQFLRENYTSHAVSAAVSISF